MQPMALGPRDAYLYVCHKCGATKRVAVTGEGRKTYRPKLNQMCDVPRCYGDSALMAIERAADVNFAMGSGTEDGDGILG